LYVSPQGIIPGQEKAPGGVPGAGEN
jgi:hypothetical protein